MNLVDLVLHLDVHLLNLVHTYGAWAYAILFAIIFSETGFVVTPFLPGDSLLFVAGAIAAGGALHVHVLAVLLVLAAVLGNSANYGIGRWLARALFCCAGEITIARPSLDGTVGRVRPVGRTRELWHRLLRRSTSESGRLRHEDEAHGPGGRRQRGLMLATLPTDGPRNRQGH